MVSESASSAYFEAAYAPSSGVATRPCTELTFTITPDPRARHAGINACASRKGP